MSERLFRNLRGTDGGPLEVLVGHGRVVAAGPRVSAPEGVAVEDGAGRLALPGLVDGHVHLDKTLWGLPWMPYPAGPDRSSRIETERRLRGGFPESPGLRAERLARHAVTRGTVAFRSHVDLDPDMGIAHLEALLGVRERLAGLADLRLVAFPQRGVVRVPENAALMAAAVAAGADLVGGIDPLTMDGDLDAQLDVVFGIAERHGVGVDLHIHDPGPGGLVEIRAIAERVQALGLAGRATVSHGFCLGAASERDFEEVAGAMARAGVSLVTHGGGASPLPPLKALRSVGVTVFAGNDDVRDAWSPFGNGDMLERAMLIAWRAGYRADEDLALAHDVASTAGGLALGLGEHGLSPGCRADFYTVEADGVGHAVSARPPRALVVKAGRVVARDGLLIG
jgi:cytosine/creatinine deaminase